jgi:hypothetical protein
MNKEYIIIFIIILLIILFIYKTKEHLTASNEAINNIATLYSNVNNTANFNNLKTNNLDVSGTLNFKDLSGINIKTNNLDVSNNITAKTISADNIIAKNFNNKKVLITFALDINYHGPIFDLSGNKYKMKDWILIPLARGAKGNGNGSTYSYDAVPGSTSVIIMNTNKGEWWIANFSDGYEGVTVLMIPTNDLDMSLSSYIDTNRTLGYPTTSTTYTESDDAKFIYVQNLKYTDDPARLKSFDFTNGLLDTRISTSNPIRGSFVKYNARGTKMS